MVSKKSKLMHKHNKLHDNTLDLPTTNNIFKTLISTLESHKGIKSQLLKSTYYLLFQLSSKQQLSTGKRTDLNEMFMRTNDGELRVSLRDLYALSNIIFKDLEMKLKQIQSLKHDDVSTTRSLQLEEVNLLIRCCVVTFTFQLPQQHLLENGRNFLLILKKLSLLEACQSYSHQSISIGSNFSGSSSKVVPFSSSILEVLIDELLVHGCVRKYLHIIHSVISRTNERLFKYSLNAGDFGILMEMICSHFSLSIYNEGHLQEFLNEITWAHSDNSKSLELSITASRVLLQNPVFLSSPKLLQAHFVSLTSNVINPDIITKVPPRDLRLISHYLPVFESSVTMYTQHMSALQTADTRSNLVILPNETSHPCFESCVDPAKRQKLGELITVLNESWNLNLCRKFFKKKPDLLASCIEYIDQNAPNILNAEFRPESISFLKSMLTRAASDDNNVELPLNCDTSLEGICLLASLLMLMSNSLIQCISYLTDSMEYDYILGIIRGFKNLNIRLPIQKFSYNIMTESCNESRLMLIHFLGLLSLSFDSGFDFLVKSCVSVIMGLTNLFVFEEGNIDALMLLANSQSLSSERSLTINDKVSFHLLIFHVDSDGNSALKMVQPLVVAAKFQKIRTLYVSNGYVSNESTPTQDLDVISMGEETCSGEMYLKTRLTGSGDVADFDDLADFVECKKGKDYVGWLNDRDKFRRQKISKKAKRMWEKKKQAWRSMRGNR